MRRAGVELGVLPSADDIIRACLDAIPVGLNEVATLADRRDLGGLDRTQMRHFRQAKNPVSAAQWHLGGVLDTHLADQLREWSILSRTSCSSLPPSYTSQTCHRCGAFGRRSRDRFHCTRCGVVWQADVNAAINILHRAGDPDIALQPHTIW